MALKRRISRRQAADDDDDGEGDGVDGRLLPAKRHRLASHDLISTLSDELLVRILAFLDERVLLAISPVSRRFHRITSDSQLWRPHYYRRFILPRAHRIPGFRAGATAASTSRQPSIPADPEWERRRRGFIDAAAAADSSAALVHQVDWKKQYKLRHNWARGRCAVDQVPVHGVDRSPPPEWQTLVKVVEGLAVTADGQTGLRAWDLKTRKLIAQTSLVAAGDVLVSPTCLAVDDQRLAAGVLDMSAGFHDGTFGVWRLDVEQSRLTLLFRQTKSYLGHLVAIAYRHPYVLTATSLGFISLYTFDFSDDDDKHCSDPDATSAESMRSRGMAAEKSTGDALLPAPHQLTSLKSHSTRLPLALSLRKTATSVVASIVYTFDGVGGWAIGIQDLDIRQPAGPSRPDVVNSRVAYTLPTQTRKSATPSAESTPARSPGQVLDSGENGPIRLCYSHPYLLATLPDNCMVLHLCTSTATSLTISPGIRLWGHTSGISDAEITPRGKAVSVSTRGDEIRLWELEGRVGGSSVEVRPRPPTDGAGDAVDKNLWFPDNTNVTDRKNWVGFDNEMVVVLKEAEDGRESLVVYDFT
ncbi:F-box-like domain-containing protein [Hirsutella rhossiliensis]|uniref:F-box-like domain-containing protein n=1 Tax=Hirsutella rhossiliensis TaxID=111463 RepID=A0A9P8MQ06_9HYPO|nr:f-box-like domain-containing protein [Hirsutella rhossiliensis]KAH0958972.1 f-box-like domain-containing protein [Hirsutella rhossiliensis]